MEPPKKTPAPMEEKRPSEDRIVMLSDGVFAIAMTLLVLDIRLPNNPGTTLLSALGDMSLKILSYVISFMMIANYWGMHRRIMHYLQRIDNSFIRINLLLLFFITALPVSTSFAFQSAYPSPGDQKLTAIIYTSSLAACGLAVAALWLNATWKHRLVDPALAQIDINYFLLRLTIVPSFFLLSLLLLLSPISTDYIYFSWLLISPIFMILRRFRHRLFPHLTEEFAKQNPQLPLTTMLSTVRHHTHPAPESTTIEQIAKEAVPVTDSPAPESESNGAAAKVDRASIEAADAR